MPLETWPPLKPERREKPPWPPPKPACPPPAWPPPCWAAADMEASSRTNVARVKRRRMGSFYADFKRGFVKFLWLMNSKAISTTEDAEGHGGIQKQDDHRGHWGHRGKTLCPSLVSPQSCFAP